MQSKAYNYQCVACRYQWQSNNEAPARCPQCKTYKWDLATSGQVGLHEPIRALRVR